MHEYDFILFNNFNILVRNGNKVQDLHKKQQGCERHDHWLYKSHIISQAGSSVTVFNQSL